MKKSIFFKNKQKIHHFDMENLNRNESTNVFCLKVSLMKRKP